MSGHAGSLKTYYAIFASLMVLTVVTVAVAFIDLGSMNDVVAMAIATFKASLVLLFFMHVKESSALTWIAILSGLFWFGIMVLFILSDIFTRGVLGFPGS